jgi:L-ascorbate metabolism protein UlaG (beta-lactamase superfamily)
MLLRAWFEIQALVGRGSCRAAEDRGQTGLASTGLFAVLPILALFLALADDVGAQSPLLFTAIQRQTNHEMLLKFTAPAGQAWRINISTNLTTNGASWRGFLTLVSSNQNEHLDSAAPFERLRFYHARQITNTPAVTGDHLATDNGEVIIHPFFHASLALAWNGLMIYVDPTNTAGSAGLPLADLILVTHAHSDHFNQTALTALKTNNTIIIAPPVVYNQMTTLKSITGQLTNGMSTNLYGLQIDAVPMYNTNASPAHRKGDGNGYVLTIGNRRIYVMGDTDDNPDVRARRNMDVAFVCMRPTFTMDMATAAAVVRDIRPKVVYPYHYAGNDVNLFKQYVGQDLGLEVRLRKWY